MKVTRHSSHCSQLSLSSSLLTLLPINIMLLTADSVLTVFNSPHPFFSIHHLTLSILQVLIQRSIFMHWNLPPSKIADDSSFCFIHNTHNIDRICPDCVRRWKWRSGLTSRTPYLQTTNQIVNRETCHGCFVKYKVYFIFLLLDGREAYLKFSVFLFLVIFHHSAISIRLCSNFNILQCGLAWADILIQTWSFNIAILGFAALFWCCVADM